MVDRFVGVGQFHGPIFLKVVITVARYVYDFSEGSGDKALFGGKGANLMVMKQLGLPVPDGFTITTEACAKYYEAGGKIPQGIFDEILEHVKRLENSTGKRFSDAENPLLVSVRSGARASMPGMMDTILNLGINNAVANTLAGKSRNSRWAWDCYRRFIQMYADVVKGVPKKIFEDIIDRFKQRHSIKEDADLTGHYLHAIKNMFMEVYRENTGEKFPEDPREQLKNAVEAVFRSWNNERAIIYRRANNIPDDWGTAVTVQEMVFGNFGDTSGTGVAFTRSPVDGKKEIYGEFLMNAQGEDVVAGIRTPVGIEKLAEAMPAVYADFEKVCGILETHYRNMEDTEFTIEDGKLFMLQTRDAKRTPNASLKIGVDMHAEGLMSKEEALLSIDANNFDAVLHPVFEPAALAAAEVIAEGLNASPGAGCGAVVFTAEAAVERAKSEPVLLVRTETSPEDLAGMYAAEGILTARGGASSHAALVARGAGIPCVSGCGTLVIDVEAKSLTIAGRAVNEGDYLSIDGTTGKVYLGELPTTDPDLTGDFTTVMEWADEAKFMEVFANADTPEDAQKAVELGAEGIGLCRTEHMFFKDDRLPAIREMIVADTPERRKAALAKLLPLQRNDFVGIFRAMGSRPVTIRLLDPPLHEFLPHDDADITALAEEMGLAFEELKSTVAGLHEANPMMGHRGCRLLITYPEIAEMQAQAIIEAATVAFLDYDLRVAPEIMVPLVTDVKEFTFVRSAIQRAATKVMAESGLRISYKVGTMIETPRAALLAHEIAAEADFFSFGTNDLTQMTYGFSRDDAVKFLPAYYQNKIFQSDPFQRLDKNGVGELVDIAVTAAHEANENIELGICGEHGGDPSSIDFFYQAGLDYVSCSPYRVPTARLAAAQAAINYANEHK
jgi:pyruvate,orthophosphate dikinase